MDTSADEIVSHIQRTRQNLSFNINELENKVKAAADWKEHFQAHPMVMLGCAFGTGAVISKLLLGGKRRYYTADVQPRAEFRNHGISGRTSETWEATKTAFAGLIASHLKDVVNDVLPGFKEHFESAQNSRTPYTG